MITYLWYNHFICVIKRLHDLNMSGFWFILYSMPFIGIFFAIYLLFKPGNREENLYGPPPYQIPKWEKSVFKVFITICIIEVCLIVIALLTILSPL
ncbi:DUF805 domain-containing protein [Candidatus Peribacteria bacterium]|nr:DUF805 domain-containing protein [Candidatus Peribacteria bacterium]